MRWAGLIPVLIRDVQDIICLDRISSDLDRLYGIVKLALYYVTQTYHVKYRDGRLVFLDRRIMAVD